MDILVKATFYMAFAGIKSYVIFFNTQEIGLELKPTHEPYNQAKVLINTVNYVSDLDFLTNSLLFNFMTVSDAMLLASNVLLDYNTYLRRIYCMTLKWNT